MAETADVQTQPFYLKKAKLKGYKSIKDAEIEFHDGLNIIIGKNASGKSNLLEILYTGFIQSIDFFVRRANIHLNFHGLKPDLVIIEKNWKEEYYKINNSFSRHNNLIHYVNSVIIKYEIPDECPIMKDWFTFNIDKKGIATPASTKNKNIDYGFAKQIIWYSLGIFEKAKEKANDDKEQDFNYCLEQGFNNILEEYLKILNNLLISIDTIDQVRLRNYRFYPLNKNGFYTFEGLVLEYLIDDEWQPYENLSDGSKRLFYLISQMAFGFQEHIVLRGFDGADKTSRQIILIEEPELGIHPHELHKLMTFIKEQSEEKQIILSTHSPMVLDVLGKDDLHRIIIASNDDSKKGSQFRHLTEEEMDKARLYMDGDYLSDYWKYSDLEG